jgi:hypothetical protein
LLKRAYRFLRRTQHEGTITVDVSIPRLEHPTIAVAEELANKMCVGASRQLPMCVTVAKRVGTELWHSYFQS